MTQIKWAGTKYPNDPTLSAIAQRFRQTSNQLGQSIQTFNDRNNDPEYQLNELLRDKLQDYKDRLDSHKDKFNKTDFSHGLWVGTKKRTHNRIANYNLADTLIKELNKPGAKVAEIFTHENLRKLRATDMPTRDVHSSELNAIIDLARAKTKPKQNKRNR